VPNEATGPSIAARIAVAVGVALFAAAVVIDYARILLLLIPRTRRDVAILALLTQIPYFFVSPWYAFPRFEDYAVVMGRTLLLTAYLPALWFLLRRPSVGPAPALVERVMQKWPRWISGWAVPPSDLSAAIPAPESRR